MSASVVTPGSPNSIADIPFSEFLADFKNKLEHVFHVRANIDQLSLQRGLPPFVLRDIMSTNPLAVCIPKQFGGRGGRIDESLAILSAASYESLALSLTFGINWALFLQPVSKYAQAEAKTRVFKRFLQDKTMGGLMITEPDYGSDALSMQSSFTEHDTHYHLEGTKHWAGLTGWADFWLLTARQQSGDKLKRDIDFFIADMSDPEQVVQVEELYPNLGLYAIPYGRNHINVNIPKVQRLEPHSSGLKMMLDILHRSRFQFPGMGMGFLKRMLDEGIGHCKERLVGGRSLFQYDQVQERLTRLQAYFTICSAMCAYSSEHASTEFDLSLRGIEANSIKSVVTDLMQSASQSLVQLLGAQGYRLDNIAGRGTVDSRPFQIFEGSNDMLYAQISEAVLKLMKRAKETNLLTFLRSNALTAQAADYCKELLDFQVDERMPQRNLVDLGRILGRLVSAELVINLGHKGFRSDLIDNSLLVLKQEVASLLTTYQSAHPEKVVEDYEADSAWLNFVSPA